MKIQHQNQHLILFESALYRTTTTLIKADNYLLLVDPNWLPHEIQYIQQIIEKEGATKEKYLLFTHSDYDHILGYKAFPNFTTIASKAFVEKEDKEQVLEEIRKFDDEYYIHRNYPITYPSIDLVIDPPKQQLVIHNDRYHFYAAPGHTKDGLIVFNQSKNILVIGDYLSNIEFPFIYDSLVNYRYTLQILQQIVTTQQVAILVTGHGDATSEVVEIQKRIEESIQYLNDLEKTVRTNTPFDVTNLLAKYPFPNGLEKCHQENMSLCRKELLGMKN